MLASEPICRLHHRLVRWRFLIRVGPCRCRLSLRARSLLLQLFGRTTLMHHRKKRPKRNKVNSARRATPFNAQNIFLTIHHTQERDPTLMKGTKKRRRTLRRLSRLRRRRKVILHPRHPCSHSSATSTALPRPAPDRPTSPVRTFLLHIDNSPLRHWLNHLPSDR